MKHFRFYIEHAFRDMARNGRRTAFALFCVAAGVAAIVALRTLSLTIGDSMAANIAGVNHGDMRIGRAFSMESSPFDNGREALPAETVSAIKAFAERNNMQMTQVISDANIQVAPLDNRQNVGRPQFIGSYIIDPAVYPFYGPVVAIDPPGVPLSKLFTGGNDVVISKNLADNNKIKVGDRVRVGRTTELFTVRGIVPTEIEGSLQNFMAAFFGFAYFDRAQTKTLNIDALPSDIYLLAPQGANIDQLGKSLRAEVPNILVRTTLDLRKQNQVAADIIDRLILVMGLAALLIGGTGIIHTMLVVVGRRMLEIAVFKTLGVKGRDITLMFVVEALIMAIIGSIFGVVLGIIFSVFVWYFTQSVWPTTLSWRIYPEAMLTGVLLGVIITTVFGFIPTLAAAAVRPALVLRPNDARLPVAGCLQTVLAILVVVVAVGLVAGQLIGNLVIGVIGAVITAVIMAVLVGLLWIVILMIGALPALGIVDLRLALRGISTHRARTATTLLALIAGIFSLSVITLMAESVPRLLNFQLTNSLGGNVMVFSLIPALQRPFIIGQLKNKPGVEHYMQIGTYNGKMAAINGDRDYLSKMKEIPMMGGMPAAKGIKREDLIQTALASMGTVDVTSPGFRPQAVGEGRSLTASDSSKRNVIMRPSPWTMAANLKVGDEVLLRFGTQEVAFTIVGVTPLTQSEMNFSFNVGTFTAPIDSLPAGVSPTFEFTIVKVDEQHLNQTLVNLSSIPGVLPFDISFFEQLIRRMLSQFTAIPSIVAALSLFAGGVIIANTVSLTTLERRRQVGVMKAIGLKGWRVLLMMVLENGLIGLLGGLIGVGIGVLMTLLLSIGSSISITQSISWGTVVILMGLSLGISLIATLLSAWTAAREKPLNVLRYE